MNKERVYSDGRYLKFSYGWLFSLCASKISIIVGSPVGGMENLSGPYPWVKPIWRPGGGFMFSAAVEKIFYFSFFQSFIYITLVNIVIYLFITKLRKEGKEKECVREGRYSINGMLGELPYRPFPMGHGRFTLGLVSAPASWFCSLAFSAFRLLIFLCRCFCFWLVEDIQRPFSMGHRQSSIIYFLFILNPAGWWVSTLGGSSLRRTFLSVW